jgi:DNA-binding MarR family transcriptional regulator
MKLYKKKLTIISMELLKRVKPNVLTAILISVITLSFVFVNFLTIEYIKDLKQSQKINIKELYNLSKEDIINYLEIKQKSNQSLRYLDYIYWLMVIITYISGFLTAYLYLSDKCKKTKVDIDKLRKEIILVFPIKYRKVIEELIKSNGQEAQAVLRQKLGLDKVQMTRLIKRMEEEGFVKVKRGTKANFIELNEKLQELLGLKNKL